VDPMREERLHEMRASGYLDNIHQFAESVCAPVFLRTRENKVVQGSMTLFAGKSGFLGVTAGHVADDVVGRNLKTRQLGGAPLPAGSLIHRSRSLDLATFRLSPEMVTASKHRAYEAQSWPLPHLKAGDMILAGGYPGSYRIETNGTFDVAFVSLISRVQQVSERNLGLALNIKDSMSASGAPLAEHADLGGCSGGPMFRLTETPVAEGMRVRYELVGIIYEYSPEFELLLCHPLTSLDAEGRFVE
jgi:hypothetical protein